MTSKIINMAERMKDSEDRLLESMFVSSPILDDGFSAVVLNKVKRQVWLRRVALPLAAIIGGSIAFKPLVGLVTLATTLSTLIPADTVHTMMTSMPQLQTVILGALLLGAGLFGLRIIED